MSALLACRWVPQLSCNAHGDQKASNPLGLELQVVFSCARTTSVLKPLSNLLIEVTRDVCKINGNPCLQVKYSYMSQK